MRAFVAPGQALEAEAQLLHDGSGYAVVKATDHRGREEGGRGRDPLWRRAVPQRDAAGGDAGDRPPGRAVRRTISMPNDRDALITGIGLVSCLGVGRGGALGGAERSRRVPARAGRRPASRRSTVHPMAALELDKQIPKRGDQRQMEPWQRIGVFAAGLALESAGVKGNADLLSRMDMIVAAGGGERDYAVDAAILSALPEGGRPGRVPERAPAGRPAADPVPGAVVQPAGRQHFHRAWRDRLVAHLHGRGSRRRRRGAHRLRADRRGPGRSHPGRRVVQRRSGRTCCCITRWAGCNAGRRSTASGRGRTAAAGWCWARSAASW